VNSESNSHPANETARRGAESLIADVRKLCVIYGSQERVAKRLNVGARSIQRWFKGTHFPQFEHYLVIKQALAEELEKARQEDPDGRVA